MIDSGSNYIPHPYPPSSPEIEDLSGTAQTGDSTSSMVISRLGVSNWSGDGRDGRDGRGVETGGCVKRRGDWGGGVERNGNGKRDRERHQERKRDRNRGSDRDRDKRGGGKIPRNSVGTANLPGDTVSSADCTDSTLPPHHNIYPRYHTNLSDPIVISFTEF